MRQKQCTVCGRVFVARQDARVCGATCRQRAHRQRHGRRQDGRTARDHRRVSLRVLALAGDAIAHRPY
jgi:hypothetical protein